MVGYRQRQGGQQGILRRWTALCSPSSSCHREKEADRKGAATRNTARPAIVVVGSSLSAPLEGSPVVFSAASGKCGEACR